MSRSYSANQYQNAFDPKRLQNWEVAMKHRENNWKNLQHTKALHAQNPTTRQGGTMVIGTNRGHIIDGVPRSDHNPWGNFVGTWDLPTKLPGNLTRITTARTGSAVDRLQRERCKALVVISGKEKNVTRGQQLARVPQLPAPVRQRAKKNTVSIIPDPIKTGHSLKKYPKTPFPKPEDYTNLTPLDSDLSGYKAAPEESLTNQYPVPDTSRTSPHDFPVGRPTNRRSPTTPQRSPPRVRCDEQAVAL